MSIEYFGKLFDSLRNLPPDHEGYKKMNKSEIVDNLLCAIKALKSADETIKKQSDTLVNTTNELVKQCELSRASICENNLVADPQLSKTFSAAIKAPPTIIMKQVTQGERFDKKDLNDKMKAALKGVHVNNAYVKENGTLVINVPNDENHAKATENLRLNFSEYSIENSKKIMPKLTITNVPLDILDDSLIACILSKDRFLNDEVVKNAEVFEVIKSWNTKSQSGTVVNKHVVVKCSPKIRNYIINSNNGYVYFDLVRSKAYDRFFVPQCYHCRRFNHFATSCPDKDKIQICGRCTGNHDTKNCPPNNSEKCANCCRSRRGQDIGHASFSPTCPCLVSAKKILMDKTDYNDKKN